MKKNLLILLVIASVSFQITSCTSSKSQDESEVVENADVDKIEAEDSLAEGGDQALTEDASMQAALGEDTGEIQPLDSAEPADTASAEPQLPTDVAAAPTLDESSLNDVPAPTTEDNAVVSTELPPPITNEVVAETEAPVAQPDNAPGLETSGINTAAVDAPAKPADTLKKIATTAPYQTPNGWVNTVYVARPGETLKDISQKIFAADKTKDLKKIAENNYLKWRSVRPGDKVYYISPNRPEDSSKTLVYFEDMGMVPETYVAQKGDNLKKVAKKILGYDKGYIELWTSNPVESKAKLAEGEALRYWRSASGVTGNVASNNGMNSGSAQLIDQSQASQMMPPPSEPYMNNAPPPTEMMPPPPTDTAAALPPPPDQPMPAMDPQAPPPPSMDTASLPPPPPPPPMETAPPPPPVEDVAAATVKPPKVDEEGGESEVGGLNNDNLMSLGAVGVLTALLAFALIRRKKKKDAEMAAAMNETHVGS